MEAHLAHNQEYAGSSPVSATLLLFVGRSVSDRELLKLKINLVIRIKQECLWFA